MLKFTMNSTMEQLRTEGFVQLEFSCKDCRNVCNRWLNDIENFLTLRQVQAGSACGRCGQATQYLKPLQKQHSAQISEQSSRTEVVPYTLRPVEVHAKRIDANTVAEISGSYSSYIETRARQNILERLVTSGNKWPELSSSEQRFLIDQECRRIREDHLKTASKLLLGMLTGLPTLF